MHELSLAESVIGIVEKNARAAGAHRVKIIRLALGALAHVEADTLLYCCRLVARDGIAAGADYEVATHPAHAYCRFCTKTVEINTPVQGCPHCGAALPMPEDGDEMRVVDIVIE